MLSTSRAANRDMQEQNHTEIQLRDLSPVLSRSLDVRSCSGTPHDGDYVRFSRSSNWRVQNTQVLLQSVGLRRPHSLFFRHPFDLLFCLVAFRRFPLQDASASQLQCIFNQLLRVHLLRFRTACPMQSAGPCSSYRVVDFFLFVFHFRFPLVSGGFMGGENNLRPCLRTRFAQ